MEHVLKKGEFPVVAWMEPLYAYVAYRRFCLILDEIVLADACIDFFKKPNIVLLVLSIALSVL